MLVLSRKEGQTIHIGIGDEITIRVSDIGQGRCRVGIEAPRDVQIWRGELFEALQQQPPQAVNRETPSAA